MSLSDKDRYEAVWSGRHAFASDVEADTAGWIPEKKSLYELAKENARKEQEFYDLGKHNARRDIAGTLRTRSETELDNPAYKRGYVNTVRDQARHGKKEAQKLEKELYESGIIE